MGKIAVPDAILLSPERLSDEEYEVMKGHSAAGERVVAGAGLTTIARWIRGHHERVDGRGYPDGLAGDAIPLEGRILAVADSFEAMTSDRYYRAALTVEHALDELQRCAGSQFDPAIVTVMIDCIASRGDLTEAAAPAGPSQLATVSGGRFAG